VHVPFQVSTSCRSRLRRVGTHCGETVRALASTSSASRSCVCVTRNGYASNEIDGRRDNLEKKNYAPNSTHFSPSRMVLAGGRGRIVPIVTVLSTRAPRIVEIFIVNTTSSQSIVIPTRATRLIHLIFLPELRGLGQLTLVLDPYYEAYQDPHSRFSTRRDLRSCTFTG
jgi:hypothetical protein